MSVQPLNWKKIPGKQTIITGKGIASFKFKTTSSATYKGYFSAVADSSSGNLTRRMWFSTTAGGEPLEQWVKAGNRVINPSDVSGNEIKLSFTQGTPANPMQCKLDRNKEYYLNYSQAGFNGSEPTDTSALISGCSVSGKP
jgi:hypothetical protein